MIDVQKFPELGIFEQTGVIYTKRNSVIFVLVTCILLLLPGCRSGQINEKNDIISKNEREETTDNDLSDHNGMIEAVYLGIKDYGAPETNRENMNNFKYRFMVNGEEVIYTVNNGVADDKGEYDYPIQNILKENYKYLIKTDNGQVINAVEITDVGAVQSGAYDPPVSGIPGQLTVKNLMKTALGPVGTTLYIFGGGWDWQDIGASVQVKSIGVSPDWVRFFNSNDETFTYRDKDGNDENKDPENSYYPYGQYNEYYYAGLDCSGYVSWVLNNTFNSEKVETDYFCGSIKATIMLSDKGLGTWTHDKEYINDIRPGDIICIRGHIWISLGRCSDGSILVLHSTPSYSRAGQPGGGVQISAIGESTDCEAYKLADKYMSEYYKEWYSRYPVKLCDPEVYLTFSGDYDGIFSWSTDNKDMGLSDPDDIRNMTPDKALSELFG